MPTHISVTDVLAVYGAALASIGFGWNLYRDLLDKPRLRLSANIMRLVQTPDGRNYFFRPNLPVEGASEQLFLVMEVTNIGRRPLRWVGWGGKYSVPARGKDFAVIPVGLPKMLNEGESHTEFTHDANPENIKRLFIWDGTDKRRYVSRLALRKLKKQYVDAQKNA